MTAKEIKNARTLEILTTVTYTEEEVRKIISEKNPKTKRVLPINGLSEENFLILIAYARASYEKVVDIVVNVRRGGKKKSEVAKELKDRFYNLTKKYGFTSKDKFKAFITAETKKRLIKEKDDRQRKLETSNNDLTTVFKALGKNSKSLDAFFKKLRGKETEFKAQDYLDYLYILRFQYMEVSVKGYSETDISFRGLIERDANGNIEKLSISKNSKGEELIDVKISQNNKPDIRLLLGLSKINEEIIKIESMMSIEITEEEMSQKYEEYLQKAKESQIERLTEVLDIGADILKG